MKQNKIQVFSFVILKPGFHRRHKKEGVHSPSPYKIGRPVPGMYPYLFFTVHLCKSAFSLVNE